MVKSGDLLTVEEAADLLGLAVATVLNYIWKGKLNPVPESPGRGKRSLFRREDVQALYYPDAYGERRKKRCEAMLAAGGRDCRGCGVWKVWEEFSTYANGINGRHSRCRECDRARGRIDAQVNREARIAYKRRYRKENRQKIKTYKREYERRCRRDGTRRAENARAYFRRYHHLTRAIEDGKTSPICRQPGIGFSVVHWADPETDNERYRAARSDQPIAKHEAALVKALRIDGVWVWHLAPIIATALRPLARRLLAFCLNHGKQRRGRPRQKAVHSQKGAPLA